MRYNRIKYAEYIQTRIMLNRVDLIMAEDPLFGPIMEIVPN